MCDRIERGQITVEFERRAGLRATEVIVINRDRDGNDNMGVSLLCYDDGDMKGGFKLTDKVTILPV